MRATTFEFRNRFWIIGAIIWFGFSLYVVDHVNTAAALATWLAAHTGFSDNSLVRLLFGAGALVTVVAALLRTWACSFLHTQVVHDSALHSENLVADGPYRYVRNPLYLGTVLLTLGMGLMASRIGYAVIVFGVLLFNVRLIAREQAELIKSQGASYVKYLDAVPCLIPSLFPRLPAGQRHSQWKQALLGEGFFWGFSLATVVFAISLKLLYFWIALAASFVLYFVVLAKLERQRLPKTGQ
jgi:protein-S-isoprenylcysteine O-methyltransferase Ste14